MTRLSSLALLVIVFSGTVPVGPLSAVAQEVITPAPDPNVGEVPDGGDAQATHDTVAIRQLMKVVDLSRLISGGIVQLFNFSQGQKLVLDRMYDAQTGKTVIPELADQGDENREGGEGLIELVASALSGALNGPASMVEAFNDLKTTFKLEDPFGLQNDELFSKKMVAQLAAKGAVASSVSENSYKRANASMDRLGDYVTALEASMDLKTSIDINTRAMIELTQQTNESLRTQAAISSMIGTYLMVLSSEASAKDWTDNLKDFNR